MLDANALKFKNVTLKHHGVKGMKWGVRRYQPYPKGQRTKGSFIGNKYRGRIAKHENRYILKGVEPEKAKTLATLRTNGEIALMLAATATLTVAGLKGAKVVGREYVDKVIKSGGTIQSITNNIDRDFNKPFYGTYNKIDKNLYSGKFAGDHLGGLTSGRDVYKKIIKTSDKMKIASHKNARKALEDTVKNNQEFRKLFERITNSTKVDVKTYERFNREIPHIHLDDFRFKGNSIKPFYDKLKSMGYNGLIDVNDQKYSGYNAINPTIIFNKGKQTVDTISKMSTDDMRKAYSLEKKRQIIQKKVEKFGKLSSKTTKGLGAISAGTIYMVEMDALSTQRDNKKNK